MASVLIKLLLFYRDEVQYVKFPKDIDDAKKLGAVLIRYKEKYFYEVMTYTFQKIFAVTAISHLVTLIFYH
jgi:hypothetical protein